MKVSDSKHRFAVLPESNDVSSQQHTANVLLRRRTSLVLQTANVWSWCITAANQLCVVSAVKLTQWRSQSVKHEILL